MKLQDVQTMVCPGCRGSLMFRPTDPRSSTAQGVLHCRGCGAGWPVMDGMARLYAEQEVRGTDRLMRVMYNALHTFHDPAVKYMLPAMSAGNERVLRDGYMKRLELGALRAPADEDPARVLEVGVGAGANLPLIARDLPPGLETEIWGLDLSEGMMADCRRRVARSGDDRVRLLMADAHALPFLDDSFDRVFHVGGIGGFRDIAGALKEMARVAKPDTPIVVVDEQLDPHRKNNLYHKVSFKLITFWDPAPRAPTNLVPPGSYDIVEEQLTRFFYGLSFKVGSGN